jgi:hypothetical protein
VFAADGTAVGGPAPDWPEWEEQQKQQALVVAQTQRERAAELRRTIGSVMSR